MKTVAQKVNKTSSHLDTQRLEALRKIFPDVFSEDKIDWDRLQAVLGESVDFGREKFGFTWKGKGAAIKNVLIPSKATLVPVEKESVDFDKTENIFIEGDNLEVLKLLQKNYFERVKVIYIDPPYNTGNDFVYRDDFSTPLKNYLSQTDQVDAEGNTLQANRETSGRFHSDWLSMLYPRLKLAWNLLKDEGVIFVSIDDNEVHHLRMLMDETFGEENFIAQIIWKKKYSPQNDATYISEMHDYIVCYAKQKRQKKSDEFGFKINLLARTAEQDKAYTNPDNDERGVWKATDPTSNKTRSQRPNLYFPVKNPFTGEEVYPPESRVWRFTREEYERRALENRFWWGDKGKNKMPALKSFLSEVLAGRVPQSIWDYEEVGHTQEAKQEVLELFEGVAVFDTPKPVRLVRRMLELATDANSEDIVLDFFGGSGTTAHAVMAQNADDGGNRKWVCVQLPEPTSEVSEAYKAGYKQIADIAKERIRRAAKQIGGGGDLGFKVFKLAPSNYVENNFDFDPEKSEDENTEAFEAYLAKAKQKSLFPKAASEDVVYENIVKEGFSLNSKIEKAQIGKNTFHQVTDGDKQMLICLDAKIESATVKKFAEDGFKGKTIIALDDALSDTDKANLALAVELKTI
jgi:adenine-specific DNA-methyltransferase